jgi:N-acetylneuraminic acid mutarotase
VSYENFIYVIGGESEQGIIGHLDRYNPNIDQWEALASKSVATTDIGAGVIGGQIYVPGGRLPSGQITTTLEVYDPHTDLWTQRTPLPTPLSAYALVTFEGRLYLFGGWDGEDYVDSTYQYDPVLDEWTELTPMPTARGFAGAAVAGGKIYVIGGTNGIQWLTNNEAYSPELDTIDISPSHPWQTRSALPTPRAYMGISALADLIYLVGGEQTPTQDPALEYVATQDTWQGFEPPGFEASWIGLELVTVGSKLYALGGKIDGIPVNYVLDYQAIFTIVFPIIQK